MIPRRGMLRSTLCLGFPRTALPRTYARISPDLSQSSVRHFGSTLRSHVSSLKSGVGLSVESRRRIAAAASIPGLATSNTILSSIRQARYASTQPTPIPTDGDVATTGVDGTGFTDVTSGLDLSGSDLLNMPETIGYLQQLGLDFGWGPTSVMMWVTEHTYIYTGLPWWATLGVVALASRLLFVKLLFDAAENAQKMQELRKDPAFSAAYKRMQDAARRGDGLEEAMLARREVTILQRGRGINNFLMLAPLVPAVSMYGMWRLLRAMTALPVPSLETGGFLWLPDLTVADPFFVLPAVGGLFMYLSLTAQVPHMAKEQQRMMKMISWVLVPVGTIVTLQFPAAIQLYLLYSGFLQWLQTTLLYWPAFRNVMGYAPLNPSDGPTSGGGRGRGSPFANYGGSWQAPRTIDTTARPKDEGIVGVMKEKYQEYVKPTIDQASKKMDESAEKSRSAKAREHEKKRSLQDKEDYLSRIQRQRMRSNDKNDR